MDAQTAGRRMTELLGLTTAPVAVSFAAAAPAGVPRVAKAGPAGCAYWKQAAEGAVFYTEAADHYNCPVGSYTHGVTLPPARAKELEDVVGTMVGRRAVLHDPGRESGRGGRAAGDGAARQSPAGAVPPGTPGESLTADPPHHPALSPSRGRGGSGL